MTTHNLLKSRVIDVLYVLALAIYTLVGVAPAPFHGDEPMQLYMSRDYVIAFVIHDPDQLLTQPPYNIDTDPQLRILNGSVNRYAIGLAWNLAGYSVQDLPPRPGWDWGLSYDRNVETGHRPTEEQLTIARLPSALFFAASIGAMFLLSGAVGGRGAAFVTTAIYALHPALLVNGRRALQEGEMLFFGLLALWCAAKISAQFSRHSAPGTRHLPRIVWWIGLTLACGLTLVSKHSGIVFVAAALGWVLSSQVGVLAQRLLRGGRRSEAESQAAALGAELRALGIRIVQSIAVAAGTIALFVALSPALWNDPVARFSDLLAVRAELLDIQATVVAGGAMPLSERVEQIVVQPFIAPVMYYEADPFAEAQPVSDEIARYEASPLSGIHWGTIGGVLLTTLAALGIGAAVWSLIASYRAKPSEYSTLISQSAAIGLLIWLIITVASLLANPLPWQRYYLTLMTIAAIYAAVGLVTLIEVVRARVNPG